MTSRFAGRRWNWRGAAKVGESCLTVEPVEVLPGGDQQLTCVAGADAEERNGAWSGLGNQRLEVPIERSDLCIQDDNALAEGAQGKLGSLNRLVHPSLVRAQSSTHAGLAAEPAAMLGECYRVMGIKMAIHAANDGCLIVSHTGLVVSLR